MNETTVGIRARQRRRGAGIAFIVVMIVLVFLAVIGLGVKYFTRGATRVGESVLAGEEAVQIAMAALDEAWASIEAQVNDPEQQLFLIFARPHNMQQSGNDLTMTFTPTHTIEHHNDNSQICISPVTVRVPRQYTLWGKNPFEKYGQLRATCTVSVTRPGLGRQVQRAVTQWREFKVLYPSPPLPFDAMTVFVLNPIHLWGYERQYRKLQKFVDDKIKELEDEASDRNPFGDVDLPRPFENNDNVYTYFSNYNYPPFPYNARSLAPSSYDIKPPLGTSDLDNYLFSFKESLEGEHFKLRWPENLEAMQNDPFYQQLMQDLNDMSSSATPPTSGTTPTVDPAEVTEMQNRLNQLRDNSDVLRLYETYITTALDAYADTFKFVKEDAMIEFNETYLAPLLKVDVNGTITVDDAIDYYSTQRCSHVYPDNETLWREVTHHGTVLLDGVYYVNGAVNVNMAYRGRGSIVGRNTIVVDQCRKANGRADKTALCTLMSFCRPEATSSWQSIVLNCDAEAGIVALAGLVKNLHQHHLYGSLAVAMLGPEIIDGKGDGTTYDWSVTHDPNLCFRHPITGDIRLDRASVLISPTLVGMHVGRVKE